MTTVQTLLNLVSTFFNLNLKTDKPKKEKSTKRGLNFFGWALFQFRDLSSHSPPTHPSPLYNNQSYNWLTTSTDEKSFTLRLLPEGRIIIFLDWGGVWEIFSCRHFFLAYTPPQTSFSNFIFVQTIFPCLFFSVFFLFVLNITIASLNYFTKNAISSAIATYFVDKRSTHFLNFFWQLLTQIKGIRQEIGVAGFFAIPQYQIPDPLWWCSHRPSYRLVPPRLLYQERRQALRWFEMIAVVTGHSK